jgi:hypothetical protein
MPRMEGCAGATLLLRIFQRAQAPGRSDSLRTSWAEGSEGVQAQDTGEAQ